MIIGLSGKKQSGKSSLSDYLRENYGFIEVSWAGPLKAMCMNLFGLTEEQVYGTEADKEEVIPKWGMSSREILQRVGTECFRKQILDDFWVVLGVDRILDLHSDGYDVIVSDCRFPNEMNAIRNMGGQTTRIQRVGQKSNDTHASEMALDGYQFDRIISAESGDLDGLYAQMDDFIIELERQDATIQ